MGNIRISGLRVYGRHGVSARERTQNQPFDIDLTVEMDLAAAAASDDIADTLDYARLQERVVATVRSASFALLERLADAILESVLQDARVARAEITISKPNVLAGATPSITLSRVKTQTSP